MKETDTETLGQRILRNRRELGLSQEALGEKLGVSRQAIYKWESDTTMPEIEKLVALSRIFSVTVGELLGVEDSAQTAAENPELTPSQIRMVEEIVSRYQASLPAPQPPRKRRRWPAFAAAAVLLVLAVSMLQMNDRMRSLQNRYQNLQVSVGQIDNRVEDRIQTITGRVEEVLTQVNSFTTDHHAKIASCDFAAGTVTFEVYAAPKVYTEGMTAVFTAKSGTEVREAAGIPGDSRDFSAELTIPLTDEAVELGVTLVTDDRQEIQPIQRFDGLYSCSFAYEYLDCWPLLFDIEEDVLEPGHMDHSIVLPQKHSEYMPQSRLDPEKCRMGLFADGVLVCWLDRTAASETELTFVFQDPIPLDREKTYLLAAVLVDEYGRELVAQADTVSFRGERQGWDQAGPCEFEKLVYAD